MTRFLILMMLIPMFAIAGKIQRQGIKTPAECVAAGSTAAECSPRDSQIYVTGGSINKQLDVAIADGDISSGIGLSGASSANNLALTASVGSNALTIALKNRAGADPSSGDAVKISMRNGTATNGTWNIRTISSAMNLIVSSGSTLGHASGVASYIYVYLIDSDGVGTMKLGVSSTLFDDKTLQTTVAGGGAGAADSFSIIYSDAAYSSKPIRVIGRLNSTQTTAGTWAAVPTEISTGPIQTTSPLYGEIGGCTITGSGCDWTKAVGAWTAFDADADCTYTCYGSAVDPATKIPGIKFPSLSAGNLYIVAQGDFISGTYGSANIWNFQDGAQGSGPQTTWVNPGVRADFPTLTGRLTYTQPQGVTTIQIWSAGENGGSTTSRIRANSDSLMSLTITAYRIPVALP